MSCSSCALNFHFLYVSSTICSFGQHDNNNTWFLPATVSLEHEIKILNAKHFIAISSAVLELPWSHDSVVFFSSVKSCSCNDMQIRGRDQYFFLNVLHFFKNVFTMTRSQRSWRQFQGRCLNSKQVFMFWQPKNRLSARKLVPEQHQIFTGLEPRTA